MTADVLGFLAILLFFCALGCGVAKVFKDAFSMAPVEEESGFYPASDDQPKIPDDALVRLSGTVEEIPYKRD